VQAGAGDGLGRLHLLPLALLVVRPGEDGALQVPLRVGLRLLAVAAFPVRLALGVLRSPLLLLRLLCVAGPALPSFR
jgi:hypothetical protein